MSVNKSERILNLFFVLINSKRPISRSEIRKRVNGYEGCESDSAFERMFERDKDELRNTGIKIDTVPIDPLFDDELGYQIDSRIFLTKSVEWTPSERAILSLASNIWHRTEFENLAKSATLKTGSSIKVDPSEDLEDIYSEELIKFRFIMSALNSRSTMHFRYFSFDDVKPKERNVIPKNLYRQGENWYLNAFDLESGISKTYQTNRIIGEIKTKPASEIEKNLLEKANDSKSDSKKVRVSINQDPHHISHITGGIAVDGNVIEFKYFDEKSFAKYLIRLSSIIVSIDNEQIRSYYLAYLDQFLKALSHD